MESEDAGPVDPSADPAKAGQVAGAFAGEVAPTPVGAAYKAGLLLVALAMVSLPIIYFAFIALSGYGIYWHATQNFGLMTASGGAFARLVAYGAPLVIGLMLLLFMLKPLFVRPQRVYKSFQLNHQEAPALFRFVGELCRRLGAPPPSRIDLDCQINASAGFNRGFTSMFSNDLVLTIGLPLVAGLSSRQLAGVIAHEFGHFAQGTGMRLTYTIRRINHWFARLVYERDAWDQQLEDAARSSDIRIGLVLQVARLAIWLTRRLLWVLMVLGHGISCFALRQMEYDADSYECKVAGSDEFREVVWRLHLINAGNQIGLSRLQQLYETGRLVGNLPQLIARQTDQLAAEIVQKLGDEFGTQKTRWHDTHPSDGDRMAAAAALAESGIFNLEAPASWLFEDFDALSEKVTRFHYRENLRLPLKQIKLVAADEVEAEGARLHEESQMASQFFGHANLVITPVALDPDLLIQPTDFATASALNRQGRRAMEDWSVASAEATEGLQGQEAKRLKFSVARTLIRAGFKLKPAEFGLRKSTLEEADMAIRLTRKTDQPLIEQANGFVQATTARMVSGLQLWSLPELDHHLSDRPGTFDKIRELCRFTRQLSEVFPNVRTLQERCASLLTLVENGKNASDGETFNLHLEWTARDIRTELGRIDAMMNGYHYPFEHARGQIRMRDFLVHNLQFGNELQEAYVKGQAYVDRCIAAYHRAMAILSSHVITAEQLIPEESATH